MRASTATRICALLAAAHGDAQLPVRPLADVAEDEVLVTYELTKTDGRVFATPRS